MDITTDALENLEQRDYKLITALLSTRSVAAAAEEAGMSASTAYRRLKRPEVRDAYLSLKAESLEQASLKLAGEVAASVDTLTEIRDDRDAPHAARRASARDILDYAYAAQDFDELAAVVEELQDAE